MGIHTPILGALRTATAGYHSRIERLLDILGTDWSVARYSALLARFYGYYQPLENLLARIPLGELGLEPEARSKSELLELDLCELGIDGLARSRVPTCN